MAMSLAIITFIAVILLAIIVKINFADTEVSVPSRIIISSVILLLFASGIYYLVTPDHVESSSQVSATPTPVSKADTGLFGFFWNLDWFSFSKGFLDFF